MTSAPFAINHNPYPQAFLCTSSRQIMEDPVLALCGHIFERTVAQNLSFCPEDKEQISELISLEELKQEIVTWKTNAYRVNEFQTSSSTASTAWSLNNAEFLKRKISEIQIPSRQATAKKHQPIKRIKNAHDDDIHGFIKISDELFVSGSKDTSLKIWNMEGDLVKTLLAGDSRKGYQHWVTALSKFRNDHWASGTRAGLISIWNKKGENLSTIQYHPSSGAKQQYVCKQRNKTRINCITQSPLSEDAETFYTGTPKFIQLWDAKTRGLKKYYQASENDWVYCIEVLENNDLLVAIGGDLEYWTMQDASPIKSKVFKEVRKAKQRPLISAITRLENNKNLVSAAIFDGQVKIIDLMTQKITRNYKEHRGRVWSVMNLKENILASSADDGTIKIWDTRESKSLYTIDGNQGRVSSLLKLNENVFISGSCPDNPYQSAEKASITFWDVRQLNS